ncbi:MAG: amidase [Marinibacterium sp.]
MSAPDLTRVSATEAAAAIRDGRLLSEALVTACLENIDRTEPAIRAWAHLDPDLALDQAREADRIRKAGRATGPLQGVPVGVKDIVDTVDWPTERGSAAFAGRQPDADAEVINRLREAGAVIMGKTRTTELAFVHPTVTTNPHDPARSPGGSSSGSAAAVAAGHVPLAIGSQTGGSVIRPASYCGIYGFKPSRGMISRHGVLQTSRTLDHIGTFGRTLADTALLADAIASYDPRDPDSIPRPRPDCAGGAQSDPPIEPNFAFLDFPFHDRLAPDAREGIEAVIDALGGRVERLPVDPSMASLIDVHQKVHEYEFCQNLAQVIDTRRAELSDDLAPIIERGRAITAGEYADLISLKEVADTYFARHFNDFDAIVAPSATGEAPLLADGTGDPVFCRLWSMAGLPAVSGPLLVGANGLPVGVQFVGGPEQDDRLMRTIAWAQRALLAEAESARTAETQGT